MTGETRGNGDDRPRVELYTDGACSGNPGPGGWAFVLRFEDNGEIEGSDGEPRTTNNRMELLGAINGLEHLERPSRVELYSDSKYVVDGLRSWLDDWKAKGWKTANRKPVKNMDLWQRLDEAALAHDVEWHWIRGHTGHPENERADELARQGISDLLNGPDR